jgi:hypothetical protein
MAQNRSHAVMAQRTEANAVDWVFATTHHVELRRIMSELD